MIAGESQLQFVITQTRVTKNLACRTLEIPDLSHLRAIKID